MSALMALWKPRLYAFRNGRLSRSARDRRARFWLFGTLGLLFWGGVFAGFYRVLTYFQRVEGFGDLLAARLLMMVIMTLFALLVFSGILASLARLYLSRDLGLVHALPVPSERVYLARWAEAAGESSWMAFLFSLPVYLSYGIVYGAGPFFYGASLLAMLALCLLAAGISALAVMTAAILLPAGRIRTIMVLVGIVLALTLVIVIRVLRPEQLVNPDLFISTALYLQAMEAPASPYLPTTWVYDAIYGSLHGVRQGALVSLGLIWSGAAAVALFAVWLAAQVYFPGYSRAQTTTERLLPAGKEGRGWSAALSVLPAVPRAFVVKEIRTFFRDAGQWTQLFLIAALIVIYLYNFSALPLDKTPFRTAYLQNLFSFLNMGLATFVLAAVAARFVFPAVSLEGSAWWIVQAAPVSLRTFLWVKFAVYVVPLLLLAQVLVVLSNLLLDVTGFMMLLSVATVTCVVPGVVALGIGLGAAYPDFNAENPAAAATSFGGLLYMIGAVAFVALVLMIEAGPVYAILMAHLRGTAIPSSAWLWMALSALVALCLCILAVAVPMAWGNKRLAARLAD